MSGSGKRERKREQLAKSNSQKRPLKTFLEKKEQAEDCRSPSVADSFGSCELPIPLGDFKFKWEYSEEVLRETAQAIAPHVIAPSTASHRSIAYFLESHTSGDERANRKKKTIDGTKCRTP